eukprot:gnl/MRDRNA2_/MRDRNA2_122329_c0_seq1.p1 gnl/MRDRNA2_/MRDRNA2_122329_c0~~gnl/MRDRNA2_/MRDRNA2_122329_c0_seq1.p1  ORF type:complete len:616 (-),score=93.23 gnl/MRDRNA2_/MRDRNA2_122329_c0_seq1:129-1976(-)
MVKKPRSPKSSKWERMERDFGIEEPIPYFIRHGRGRAPSQCNISAKEAVWHRPGVRAAGILPHEARIVHRSVVCIHSVQQSDSYLKPWVRYEQQSFSGSGFCVDVGDDCMILTNAHVVENSLTITVTKQTKSQVYRAALACIAQDLDLALLRIDDKDFWEDMATTCFAQELPDLFSEVKVAGFPKGGSTICVMKGVVSRVDAQTNTHAQSLGMHAATKSNPGKSLLIQTDAAVNSGNSGGPTFDSASGKVIGVASAAMDAEVAQNVSYIIPAMLAQNFIDTFHASGNWDGLPTLGITYRALENPALHKYLGLDDGQTGIGVTDVAPNGPLADLIHKGDILLAIDDRPIENDGKVTFRVGCDDVQLPFECAVTSKKMNDHVELRVMRAHRHGASATSRSVETVSAELTPLRPLAPRFHKVDCEATYAIFGGFVFCPVTTPLLAEYINDRSDSVYIPPSIHSKAERSWKDEEDQELVILLRGLEHPINQGYDFHVARILATVQGKPVKNIKTLIQIVGCALREGDRYLIFGFLDRDGREMDDEVLEACNLAEADAEIMEWYHVCSPCSQNLAMECWWQMPKCHTRVMRWLRNLLPPQCQQSAGSVSEPCESEPETLS